MTFQPGANVYTQGFGSRPENVEVPHLDVRAPTTTDILYPVGKEWVDTVNNATYQLTSFSASGNVTTANWVTNGGGSGALASLAGNSGVAVPSGGQITVSGAANQLSFTGAGSTLSVAFTGPYTPATYTAHGVLIGEGTSPIAATAAGTTGQVLIGSTGADPAFGDLGVNSGLTAHGVLVGEGNSAITATAVGTTGQVLIGSTGADPAFGDLGVNSGLTAHGVLLGEGNSAIAATAVGATGETLMGSTGADPGWTGSPSFSGSVTAGTGLTVTTGGILVSGGDIINSHSDAATDVTIEVTNSDNTSGTSRAGLEIATGGASSGDPYLSFEISGVGASTMSMGLDNSASDLFVISNSASLGTSNALTLSQAGALTATTSITATLGDITATNGNLSLGTAGNKLSIATGANASVGTSDALNTGTVTVNTTAVTASSIIFLTRSVAGGTLGNLSVGTITPATSFTITCDQVLDTSTVNWLIIN